MKIRISKFYTCVYLYLIVCTFAQNLMASTWISTGDQDWNTASNWDPAVVPNSGNPYANVGAGPSPIIGYTGDLAIDLNILGLDLASSQVILGDGGNKGTLNLSFYVVAENSDSAGGIKLVNGTLNFQNGLAGNLGTGLCRCIFASNNTAPFNVINFNSGSTAGTNFVVLDDTSSGFIPQGELNIKEDITLQSLAIASQNVAVNIDSGKTLTIDDLGIFTVGNIMGGSIAGDGHFAKDGRFRYTLQAANSYTGGTTVKTGTLTLSAFGTLGSGAVEVENGGQLNLQFAINAPSNSLTLNGAGGDGTGALVSNSSSTYSGPITLDSATTIGSISGTLTLSDISASGETSLTMAGDGNAAINGVIAISNGALTKDGSGVLTLSGINTFLGGTTINTGVVNIKNNSALGVGSALIASGAQLQIDPNGGEIFPGNDLYINGNGPGTGALLNVSGNNMCSGTVNLNTSSTIGCSSGSLTLSNINASGEESLTIAGTGNTNINGVVAISNGALTKNGSGVLTLSGVNTFLGGTTINAGVVNVQNGSALGFGSASIASGAQLQLDPNGGEIFPENNLYINGDGPGTGALLNVSGNNMCSGTVNLNAPSTIGCSAGSLALNNITSSQENRNLTIAGAGDVTIGGTVSLVNGSIIKTGTGRLTINGTSNAQVSVNGGTIQVSSVNDIGGAEATLSLAGGTLQVANSITSAGNVNVTENSTINTDASQVTTLLGPVIGSNGKTLALIGAGTNSLSQVTVNGSDTFTVSGPIGGTTMLAKNGTGTLVLPGTSTYTGGTSVNAGTLSIASANNIGGSSAALSFAGGTLRSTGNVTTSGAINVAENSTLTTDASRTTAFTGVLTGADGKTLTVSGAGTNTISQVAVNGSDTFTIAGAIKGETLGLTKTGTGTLILPDANTYPGVTIINEGRVSVNGQIAGGVQVNSDGTLGGTGTIFKGGTVNGILSPGNSIGTITFDTTGGDITLNSSSITNIEISPTDASKIVVTGAGDAILDGGTVNVVQQAGLYPSSGQYTILEGSYTGLFNPTVTGGSLSFSLSYAPGFVYLLFADTPPSPSSLIPTLGLSGNALALANYLNQNALSSTLSLFSGLTDAQITDAMNSISPSRNAFGPYIAAQTALSVNTMVAGHMDAFRQETRDMKVVDCSVVPLKDRTARDTFTVWAQGFGEFARQKKDFQNPSVNFNGGGLLIGFDYKDEHKNLIGGAFGYGRTNFNEYCNVGCGNVNYGSLSIYGNVFVEDFYVAPALSVLFDGINNVRNIAVPNFSARARAHMSAWQLVPRVEIGYDAAFSWANIVPFTAVDAAIVWQQAYQESGATPFNAAVGAKSGALVRSETGVKAYETWEFEWGTFFLREKVSYVFEKPCDIGITSGSFVGMPGMFTVAAVNQNLNLCALALDLLFVVGKERSVKIDLGYEGKFGPRYWSNQVVLTIGKNF